MNSSLLIVFPFTELEKFCVFFLNPDLIPELKPNLLLCNMVTIMITMRIVGKAYGNAWWPKDVRNHHYWSYFFFYLGFLSRTFKIHRTAGEWGGYICNSSLSLPLSSQTLRTLRNYPGDYHRDLTSTYSYQLDSNEEPLVSKCKLLATKPWGKRPLVSMKTRSFEAW